MNRKIKLLILLTLSMSVYFIYNYNQNATYTITSIGDQLSLGINSYGMKDYSYIDYYINKNYSKKTQTIKEVLLLLKNRPELKRVLYDTDCLIITLGYNDLLEKLAIQKEINPVITEIKNEYQEFIKEIRKYYKKEIIVIGYYTSPIMDYNQITHIRLLNKVLKNEQVVFIDTDSILNNYKKYFSNPKSIYPNYLGYERISSQIIRKTLEKI